VARARVRTIAVAAGVLLAGVVAVAMLRRGTAPEVPTAAVTRGDFVDIVEIHGEVRPLKSIIVTAPMQAGDLQILELAANGSAVKPGDVVVAFDGASLQRTIQEKRSALRQAENELQQAQAQAALTGGQDDTALLHSRYDVDRAKLGLTDDELIVSKVDAEKARLAVADAEQRLAEAEVKSRSNRQSSETSFAAQKGKIAKVQADLDQAEAALAALRVKSPANGVVSIMPNYRASSPVGPAQEFRTGDRAWAGAQILELPDLSSVHLAARLDESDRGRLEMGQHATIRVDAIADREYHATVTDLSVLARVDFTSWPPVKNFDLKLTFTDGDAHLRPGMSSTARIEVGRVPDMLLVPAGAVFSVDGRSVVYRIDGRAFAPVGVEVAHRNKDQAAIVGDIKAGDRVASVDPVEAAKGTR
jgi:multidrug efflux pump subunit AcrA (membrane-fusion protein)